MATITPTLTDDFKKNFLMATWTNLTNAGSDVGKGVNFSGHPRMSVQALGTNATTVEIEGSLDGVNYEALGAGLTLTIGASGSSPVTDIPVPARFIRPATPSAAADTDVIVVGHRMGG